MVEQRRGIIRSYCTLSLGTLQQRPRVADDGMADGRCDICIHIIHIIHIDVISRRAELSEAPAAQDATFPPPCEIPPVADMSWSLTRSLGAFVSAEMAWSFSFSIPFWTSRGRPGSEQEAIPRGWPQTLPRPQHSLELRRQCFSLPADAPSFQPSTKVSTGLYHAPRRARGGFSRRPVVAKGTPRSLVSTRDRTVETIGYDENGPTSVHQRAPAAEIIVTERLVSCPGAETGIQGRDNTSARVAEQQNRATRRASLSYNGSSPM